MSLLDSILEFSAIYPISPFGCLIDIFNLTVWLSLEAEGPENIAFFFPGHIVLSKIKLGFYCQKMRKWISLGDKWSLPHCVEHSNINRYYNSENSGSFRN